MAEFKLAKRAELKLVEIYAFTENTFGRYQADAYNAGFERMFGLLADFPRMGVEVRDLAPDHRRKTPRNSTATVWRASPSASRSISTGSHDIGRRNLIPATPTRTARLPPCRARGEDTPRTPTH